MGDKKKSNSSSSSTTQTVWFSLRKSLHCRSDQSEVHNPKTRKHLLPLTKTRAAPRSGCSRSLANLKDVIHGSKRHPAAASADRPPSSCSPRSIGSSEFLNPIAHEVILSNSKCELKITGFNGVHGEAAAAVVNGGTAAAASSYIMGTLKPGTPMHCFSNPSFNSCSNTPPRNCNKNPIFRERNGFSNESKGGAANGVRCHKCGEEFAKWEALESHHLSKHAVTELLEGDSSRKIVEIICRPSSSHHLKSADHGGVRIDRVLKVHNTPKTLARFEEYREAVKNKASKLPNKKHPRCLADGNELLRFYGTTVSCSLSSLCVSDRCCVCRIVRHGFSVKREFKSRVGVFTASTSGRAYESIEEEEGGGGGGGAAVKKALILCRVIAGRVHRPVERVEEVVGQEGFDSLAGKVGLHSNIEELYLLDVKALLPCFVVVCKS